MDELDTLLSMDRFAVDQPALSYRRAAPSALADGGKWWLAAPPEQPRYRRRAMNASSRTGRPATPHEPLYQGARLRISALGTTAMLVEMGPGGDLDVQRRIWSLARELARWPAIGEAIPGMNNLMLTFTTPPASSRAWDELAGTVEQAWTSAAPLPLEGRVVELPVVYGGAGGPHMADVVAHTGLSVAAIVAIHSEPLYPVFALGSHPGYCYLGGMDPRIATPRRQSPILELPAGSVSIGGSQTGVSASVGPSGWNTIGRTSMEFFDATAQPPARLHPGDRVRFQVQRIEP